MPVHPGACKLILTRPAPSSPVIPKRSLCDYRCEFPLLSRYVYLNSNSTGATPQSAKLAFEEYWSAIENWRDEHWERWLSELRGHANAIADFIGGPPGSVICDSNVATLLSRVMSCFDFHMRPRVITTDAEFPSIPFILHAFERYGATATVVRLGGGTEMNMEQVA